MNLLYLALRIVTVGSCRRRLNIKDFAYLRKLNILYSCSSAAWSLAIPFVEDALALPIALDLAKRL